MLYTKPKTCERKIAYLSRKAASQALAKLPFNRNRLRDSMKTYECNICGKWHLGHKFKMGTNDSLAKTFEKLKNEETILQHGFQGKSEFPIQTKDGSCTC